MTNEDLPRPDRPCGDADRRPQQLPRSTALQDPIHQRQLLPHPQPTGPQHHRAGDPLASRIASCSLASSIFSGDSSARYFATLIPPGRAATALFAFDSSHRIGSAPWGGSSPSCACSCPASANWKAPPRPTILYTFNVDI